MKIRSILIKQINNLFNNDIKLNNSNNEEFTKMNKRLRNSNNIENNYIFYIKITNN